MFLLSFIPLCAFLAWKEGEHEGETYDHAVAMVHTPDLTLPHEHASWTPYQTHPSL